MPITASAANPTTGKVAAAAQPTNAFNTAAEGAEHRAKADVAGMKGDVAHAQKSTLGQLKEGVKEKFHDKMADHKENKASRELAGDAAKAQGAAAAATRR